MRKRNYQKLVGVMLSERSYIELVRFTDEKELSVSAFIRSLIEETLREEQKQ